MDGRAAEKGRAFGVRFSPIPNLLLRCSTAALQRHGRLTMQKRWGWIVAAGLVAVGLQTLHADTYSFNLIPPTGNVGGPAGSAVGWGYSLSNESTSDWLVTSDLQAGSFLHGSPNSIF